MDDDSVRANSQAEQSVQEVLVRFVPSSETSIDEESSFTDLGVDSVSFLEILVGVEDALGISLTADPEELATVQSPEALKDLVARKIAAR